MEETIAGGIQEDPVMLRRQMALKFVGLFGPEPATFLFPDYGDVKPSGQGVDMSTFRTFEENFDVNATYPYAVGVVPHGNLGKVNTPGSKMKRGKADLSADIAAFYVDVDLKLWQKDDPDMTMDDLLDAVVSTIEGAQLPVKYVSRSGNGYHVWFFVNPLEREKIGKRYAKHYSAIQKKLSELFEYPDANSVGDARLIRLPFTKYWKRFFGPEGKAWYTSLYELDGGVPREVTGPYQI